LLAPSRPFLRLFFQRMISMRLRMLESVTRVREVQVRNSRIYMGPYALEAGDIYELAPDYAQMLMSSGKAVSVE
jgi:hypothetical protein